MLCISYSISVYVRSSVCLFVSLSVTLRYSVKTNKRRMPSSPLGDATLTLDSSSIFRRYKAQQYIRKASPLARALSETRVCPRGDFWPINRYSSETVQDTADVTIGSSIMPFHLVTNSMTLNDCEPRQGVFRNFSDSHHLSHHSGALGGVCLLFYAYTQNNVMP